MAWLRNAEVTAASVRALYELEKESAEPPAGND
jgi:hypothetical protein